MNTLDLFSLKGKVAVITGGERMYGKGCSLALTDAGAKLYMACPFVDAAEETAAEIRANGHEVVVVNYDQTDPESIRRLVSQVVEQEGRIDVFVNACRILGRLDKSVPYKEQGPAPAEPTDAGWYEKEEDVDAIMRVNGAGMLYVTRLVGEQMMKQRSGSIINFGSMMGMVGVEQHNYDGQPGMGDRAFSTNYAMNKSGIIGWTRHAAAYYGRYGVRINNVSPGGLASDRTPEVFARNYSAHTQLGRLANEDDIKGAILYLASDASAYITGINLPVDGGYTAL